MACGSRGNRGAIHRTYHLTHRRPNSLLANATLDLTERVRSTDSIVTAFHNLLDGGKPNVGNSWTGSVAGQHHLLHYGADQAFSGQGTAARHSWADLRPLYSYLGLDERGSTGH